MRRYRQFSSPASSVSTLNSPLKSYANTIQTSARRTVNSAVSIKHEEFTGKAPRFIVIARFIIKGVVLYSSICTWNHVKDAEWQRQPNKLLSMYGPGFCEGGKRGKMVLYYSYVSQLERLYKKREYIYKRKLPFEI